MPRVPVYTPQVRERPLAAPFVPEGQGVSSAQRLRVIASGAQQAAGALQQLAAKERQDADVAVEHEATMAYLDGARQITTPFFETRGKAAIEAAPDVQQQMRKHVDGIIGRASNPRQREQVRRSLERLNADRQIQIARHEHGQIRVHRNDVKDATLAQIAQDLPGFAVDGQTGAWEREMAHGVSVIEQWGRQNTTGLSEVEIEQLSDDWLSGAVRQSVEGLIDDNQVQRARELFEDNREDLLPEDVAAISDALKPEEDRAIAQQAADTIMEPYGSGDSELTPSELQDIYLAVNAIDENRGLVRQEVDRRVSEIQGVWKGVTDRIFNDMHESVRQGFRFNDLPVGQRRRLSPGQRESLLRLESQTASGEKRTTDPSRLLAWRSLSNAEKAEMTPAAMAELFPYFSDTHYPAILKEWEGHRNPTAATTNMPSAASMIEERKRRLTAGGAFAPGTPQADKKESGAAQQAAAFDEEATRRVFEFEAAKKGKATEPEIRAILDEMEQDVVVGEPGFLGQVRALGVRGVARLGATSNVPAVFALLGGGSPVFALLGGGSEETLLAGAADVLTEEEIQTVRVPQEDIPAELFARIQRDRTDNGLPSEVFHVEHEYALYRMDRLPADRRQAIDAQRDEIVARGIAAETGPPLGAATPSELIPSDYRAIAEQLLKRDPSLSPTGVVDDEAIRQLALDEMERDRQDRLRLEGTEGR